MGQNLGLINSSPDWLIVVAYMKRWKTVRQMLNHFKLNENKKFIKHWIDLVVFLVVLLHQMLDIRYYTQWNKLLRYWNFPL